jgi:hypothetical protein
MTALHLHLTFPFAVRIMRKLTTLLTLCAFGGHGFGEEQSRFLLSPFAVMYERSFLCGALAVSSRF